MPDTHEFLMVALGASAGGLEACEKFFKHMPDDAGMAFAVVMHLAPDHESALAQLLARHTRMPVEQVRGDTKAVPNHVYIIPPNATLTIEKSVLRVAPPEEPRGQRTPIDSLFRSLAEDCGERAVCIMLSGTGTDGTNGLRAIKEHGGMALAQTLESAKYDAILRSAISTGLVDHVLPVEEMPAKLVEYAAHISSLNGKFDAARDRIAQHLAKVHGLLRRQVGHDFSEYKESTIARRMDRRMKALQIETVEQYVQLLERKPEEAGQLFKDLLIGVTRFFRDPEAFEAMGREVIPKLFEGKEAGSQVRACVVGCASGEEAYSLAILLCEHASTLADSPPVQIFATDIDERGLEIARKGIYPESVAEHVGAGRLERFFSYQDGAYQVKRSLRENVIFSTHSFIKDPPFSRLDLIVCRNVMIYLGSDLQQRVIPLFHYALRSGGYLFLGPAESVSSHQDLFRTVDKKHRIFQRKESVTRLPVQFPVAGVSRAKSEGKQPEANDRNLAKQLERIVLERYGPACVIVKESGEAVYLSSQIGRYLQHPAGSPETNVVNLAREGLRAPLRAALRRAVTTRERAVQRQISVETNGTASQVDLTVEPLSDPPGADLYIIVLKEVDAAPKRGTEPASHAASEETILYLESELRAAREHAQSAYEELETSNEELQSTNEEFQSTNEELETSKEEMQSFNEELETVNAELNRKVSELDYTNSDLLNLLESTQIATIFLDAELRIKKFTPAAGSVFRLIPGDVGRPITDLAARFFGVDLAADVGDVLRTLAPCRREVTAQGAQHFQMTIMPYRTVNNVIDGVVITFVDVTGIRNAQTRAEDARIYAEDIIRTVRQPLVVLDANMRVQSANRSFYDTFRVSADETMNTVLYELGSGQWDIPGLRRMLGEVLPGKKILEDFEVEHEFPDLGRKTMLLNAGGVQSWNGDATLILLAIEDITARKQAEESLRVSEERYRSLFNSIDEGFCIIEMIFDEDEKPVDFRYLQVSPSFERQTGLKGAQGKRVRELIPQLEEHWFEIYGKIALTGEPERFENHAETLHRWFDVYALRFGEPKDRQVAVLFSDVTERKRVQAALSALNEDLKHFAYAASHDLQEPLRMVISSTQLLSRRYQGKLDGQADQFIGYAVDGAKRMEMLLAALRDYWSVNDRTVEQDVVLDCNRALEAALKNLEMRIQEGGAVVTYDPLPTVLGEEMPLTLLFQNLIGNGIKYRRQGETPRVHVSAERNANIWKFSVSDNGIGIKAENAKAVFAPFKRLHGPENPGTGIGLAICQKITERYGGRIWVESVYGQGSTFYFTLYANKVGPDQVGTKRVASDG